MSHIDIERIDEYSLEELQEFIQTANQKPIKKIQIRETFAVALFVNFMATFVVTPGILVGHNIRNYWWGIPVFLGVWIGLGIVEYVGVAICRYVSQFFEIVED